MVTNLGLDIQDINSVEKFIGTSRMSRLFSKNELDYITKKNSAPKTIAGMFCAKEAFFKALGTGITNLTELTKVEIGHDRLGAPRYIISQDLIDKYNLGHATLLLSISHTKTVSAAVCCIAIQ